MLVGRGAGPFLGYAWKARRTKSERPLAPFVSPTVQYLPLFAAAGKVAAADVIGSYTQRSGNLSGVHGARFLWGAMA